MTILESAIWIMTLSLLFVANVNAMMGEAAERKHTGKFNLGMFLFNAFAAILVLAALIIDFNMISTYQKAPKVYTTVAPQIDTVQENNQTFYIYHFQDNHYPDFK